MDRYESGEVERTEIVVTKYGDRPELEVLITRDDGITENYRLRGDNALLYRDYLIENDLIDSPEQVGISPKSRAQLAG
jgi:hypothetical protein